MAKVNKVAIQPSDDATATALAIAYQLFDDDEIAWSGPRADNPKDRAALTGRLAAQMLAEVSRTKPPP